MNILSNVIVDLLGYNNPEERQIYKYGVQILLSDLSNFLIIIVPSLIFNKLSEGIVFLITFISIRRYCGGFHCSSCLRCNITFLMIFTLSFLPYGKYALQFNICYIFSLVGILYITLTDEFIEYEFKKKTVINIFLIPLAINLFIPSLIIYVKFTVIAIYALLLLGKWGDLQ